MLSSIKATNFLSWKNLEFDVTKGVTLIDGWNEDDQRSEGSGKSAILNAISWCLFGALPKEANIDDVIKDGESSCQVTLEFDNGDAIVRSRKPNDLYILKAGATVKGKDASETKALIEEYIGLNFDTFCQSIYFAQNYDKKFLTSGQPEKGKILSSIQNLQIFDKARKEVMDLASLEDKKIITLRNQIQVQENNEANYKSQKTLVESFITDKIQKHQAQVNMVTQQRDLVAGHVLNTQSQIESINQRALAIDTAALNNDEVELAEAKTQYGAQLADVTYKKNQIDSIKRTIQSKEIEGNALATKYQNLQNKVTSLSTVETQPQYLRLMADQNKAQEYNLTPSYKRLVTKKQELKDFLANPSKNCPSCGTTLKNLDATHVQAEFDSVINELISIENNAMQDRQRIADDIIKLTAQIQKDVELVQAEITEVLSQLTLISTYLDENKIPSMEDLVSQETEIRGIISQIDKAILDTQQKKNEYNQLLNQHSALTSQYNNYVSQKTQLDQTLAQLGSPDVSQDQQKLRDLDDQLGTVKTQLEELRRLHEASRTYVQRLESLKDGFKEIKSYVFTNALNELNFRTNQYLSELFEMEATIKFSNDDQKIESKIVLNGKERSLGLLSGGQSRRFNLAVDLALSDIVSAKNTSKLDILIFDEYFKDLSEISMEKSLDLLKDRKCPVILIEHNSIFKNVIDNTFFVRLQNGTTSESRA